MTKRIIPILIIIIMSVFAISLTRTDTDSIKNTVTFKYGN